MLLYMLNIILTVCSKSLSRDTYLESTKMYKYKLYKKV